MNVLDDYAAKQMKPAEKLDDFNVGDTVKVHFRIVEGEKERIQIFEGIVLSRKGGTGPLARFTVRRVAHNEGVERVFPLHSPRVERVEVTREGHVRRAKLHYLRDRIGKSARVKAKGRAIVQPKAEAPATAEAAPEAASEETPSEE